MNNQPLETKIAHWDTVASDIKELRATNGLGWAVHALLMPAGWTQIGLTQPTSDDALIDMACMSQSDEELMVYEVLG